MIVVTMRLAHAVETARLDRVGKIAGEAVRAAFLMQAILPTLQAAAVDAKKGNAHEDSSARACIRCRFTPRLRPRVACRGRRLRSHAPPRPLRRRPLHGAGDRRSDD